MNSAQITALADAVAHVLRTTLQLEASVDPQPGSAGEADPGLGFVGEIEVRGVLSGRITLGFPRRTADRLAGLFLGEATPLGMEKITDALAELTDMVRGCVAARWADPDSAWSPPRVRAGEGEPARSLGGRAPVVTCVTECGDLHVAASVEGPGEGPAAPEGRAL